MGERPTLALSVDVEGWAQSTLDPEILASRHCADNVKRLLELLGDFPGARGTFFVLGKFARQHPSAIKEIVACGHEIACHGYGHLPVYRLSPAEFAEDLQRSTETIADLTGVRARGYRAPFFSIVRESLWALEVLAESGYRFDSSILPIRKAVCGIPGWPRHATRLRLASGRTIVELPIGVLDLWGSHWPGGGGYARLIPGPILFSALRKTCHQLPSPPVFYCHPYEFDPDEFNRLGLSLGLRIRLHQGIGRKGMTEKFRTLLKRFRCVPLGEFIPQAHNLPILDCLQYTAEPGNVRRPRAFAYAQSGPWS